MGMSSTMGNVGSMLNSGLTQPNNQQDLGNPSIGMPYGPGYTDPNQQQGPGDLTGQIGMPAGPGYMQPSTGGKGGMPSVPQQGPEPMFNLPNPVQNYSGGTPQPGMPGVGFGMGGFEEAQFGNPYANPTLPIANPLMQNPNPAPIDMPGQIGMPAGPGYMQPPTGQYRDIMPKVGGPTGADASFKPIIGLPAGPGYMQPTPLPSPTVKAQPTPLPPATGPNLGQPQIGMPAGPGFMQPKAAPKPAPITKPIVRPAPIPQTRQQIVQQVGIRQNQKAPTKVQPSLSTRPTGRIGRR